MDDSRIASTDDGWNPAESDRDPVEELAADFVERRRRGEHASVDEYVSRYPQFAEDIRNLFPTIAAMEGLHRRMEHDVNHSWSRTQPQIQQLGDFRVIGEIGRGGMGVVYEAEQESLGRRVAVKVLKQPAICDEKDVRRFQREAKTAARLHHPNIVQVFGVGEQDGHHYLVMELINGVGLDEILDEIQRLLLTTGDGARPELKSRRAANENARQRSSHESAVALLRGAIQPDSRSSSTTVSAHFQGLVDESSASHDSLSENGADATTTVYQDPPSDVDSVDAPPELLPIPFELSREYWRNVARLGAQVANAVQYAHSRGTLHRDIKPGNLLLDRDGNVHVVDFGLAMAAEHGNLTWTGDVVGTISYLAPERFHGQADVRSDVYSIGLTLYEMLTLRRAFDDTDRAALVRRICHEEVIPPRKLSASVPRDLDTIVQKAIAGLPADRYQSAGELADDLVRFLEDRPIRARRTSSTERTIRWARRNPAIAGLTATVAALVVFAASLAAVGYTRQAAERNRAQETARIAVEALDNIYDQFSPEAIQLPSQALLDATEIEAVESDLLLESESPPLSKDVALILENLLEFYDRLSNQTTDNSTVIGQSILASRRVGDIRYRLGDVSKAEAAYRRAIGRTENAGLAVADNPSFSIELGRIYNGLGITLDDQRQPVEAREAHQRALIVLQAAEPNLARDYELARTYYLLHVVENKWRRGRSARTNETWTPHNYVQQAVSIIKERIESGSNVPQLEFLLARCFRAPIARSLRDSAWDRDQAKQQAIDILERLVTQYPEVADFRFELAEAYSGDEFRRLFHRRNRDQDHDPDADALRLAEENVRRSLEVTDNLVHSHPNIPEYISSRVRLHYLLAAILKDMERVNASIIEYQNALAVQKSMIGISARPTRSRLFYARIQLQLAAAFRQIGHIEQSQATLAEAVTDLNALAEQVDDRDRSWVDRLQREANEVLRSFDPAEST